MFLPGYIVNDWHPVEVTLKNRKLYYQKDISIKDRRNNNFCCGVSNDVIIDYIKPYYNVNGLAFL